MFTMDVLNICYFKLVYYCSDVIDELWMVVFGAIHDSIKPR